MRYLVGPAGEGGGLLLQDPREAHGGGRRYDPQPVKVFTPTDGHSAPGSSLEMGNVIKLTKVFDANRKRYCSKPAHVTSIGATAAEKLRGTMGVARGSWDPQSNPTKIIKDKTRTDYACTVH